MRKCFMKNAKEDASENNGKRFTHRELFQLFDIGLK